MATPVVDDCRDALFTRMPIKIAKTGPHQNRKELLVRRLNQSIDMLAIKRAAD
jgi:hypothetical protein